MTLARNIYIKDNMICGDLLLQTVLNSNKRFIFAPDICLYTCRLPRCWFWFVVHHGLQARDFRTCPKEEKDGRLQHCHLV